MATDTKEEYKLLASLVCGDPLELRRELEELKRGEIDGLHFDVMDGQFVPRLGLYPEYLKAVRKVSDIPIDVHMMVAEPEKSIQAYIDAGMGQDDYMVVHVEATQHVHQAIRMIKASGVKAGVALNPATPLSTLDYILPELDLVVIMAINPGILGHKLIPDMLRKIRDAATKIKTLYPHVEIQIDGGVSPESAATMVQLGATMLVCGTSSIYKPPRSLEETTKEFRELVDQKLTNDPAVRALQQNT